MKKNAVFKEYLKILPTGFKITIEKRRFLHI